MKKNELAGSTASDPTPTQLSVQAALGRVTLGLVESALELQEIKEASDRLKLSDSALHELAPTLTEIVAEMPRETDRLYAAVEELDGGAIEARMPTVYKPFPAQNRALLWGWWFIWGGLLIAAAIVGIQTRLPLGFDASSFTAQLAIVGIVGAAGAAGMIPLKGKIIDFGLAIFFLFTFVASFVVAGRLLFDWIPSWPMHPWLTTSLLVIASALALVIISFASILVHDEWAEAQVGRWATNGLWSGISLALGLFVPYFLFDWEIDDRRTVILAASSALLLLLLVTFCERGFRIEDARLRQQSNRFSISIRSDRSGSDYQLRRACEERFAEWETSARDTVIPRIFRSKLNELGAPGVQTELTVRDAPGLRDLNSEDFLVETDSFARVRRLLRESQTGAIGIAGPRGAGKTTILRTVSSGRLRDWGPPLLAIHESVPVQYDGREFVLHLYARLCTQVLALNTGTSSPNRWVRAPGTGTSGLDRLVRDAEGRLNKIHFQQRYSHDWSGKLSLPFGAEASATRSKEWTERVQSYPEIVHEFRSFLRNVHSFAAESGEAGISIVFTIDELDKMGSWNSAETFINEIKAIFSPGEKGCMYLVSVSEEALSSFEQEGIAVRDAFNSAFDDVVRVNYLSLSESQRILRSRVLGMSLPFEYLCYCLSGGLPRELVREAQSIIACAAAGDTSLERITRKRVVDDLERGLHGLRSASRGVIEDYPKIAELLRVSQRLATGTTDAATILDSLSYLNERGKRWGRCSNSFRQMWLSTLNHLYYTATVLEWFSSDLDEETLQLAALPGDSGNICVLANSRTENFFNPIWSWRNIDRFRSAWSLPLATFPLAEFFD